MFDKLIESNSAGAEFKPRRKFFMVSSVVVGIAFLTAVVFSLYAQDLDLGTDNFEFAELLAPIVVDAPEPEPPPQPQQQRNEEQESELPSRKDLIASIDQPQHVPTEISTTPNTSEPVPPGPFIVNPSGPETDGIGTGPVGNKDGSPSVVEPATAEVVRVPDPPPIIKTEPRKPVTISKGVINGTALSLPKPPYSPMARAINLTGEVSVQVLIDEHGDVVSANAVSGHAFFKLDAERAARKAKFRPTYLSDQAVKVTGVIVYKFSR